MLMPAIAGVGALRDAFFASGAGRKRSPPTPSLLFCQSVYNTSSRLLETSSTESQNRQIRIENEGIKRKRYEICVMCVGCVQETTRGRKRERESLREGEGEGGKGRKRERKWDSERGRGREGEGGNEREGMRGRGRGPGEGEGVLSRISPRFDRIFSGEALNPFLSC